MHSFLTKMHWATSWAIFSQTLLTTTYFHPPWRLLALQTGQDYCEIQVNQFFSMYACWTWLPNMGECNVLTSFA
jgi:hypothetical protein